MVGNQSTYFAPEPKTYEDMAILKTLYEKPTDIYPEGRRLVVANGVLLESGPMPYAHGLYPLIKVSDIEVSGSFWDIATMENLIPVQKGYNRTWSQIIENANNMGNIKVWLEKDHGLQKESYDDSGTEVLEVNAGKSVNQLQPAELPAYVQNQIANYDRAFEDISGMHEISQGRIPAGIKSGRAILALQEQDDTRLAPTKIRLHRAIEELGYMALQLYAEFQEEEREYQIVGNSAYDLDEFRITRAEIQSMKKDVRVQSENIIASHKRMQQENVLEMYDKGLFGDPKQPEVRKKVLQLLEFGNVADLFDDINLDESQARRENRQFINSEDLFEVESPFPPLPGMEGSSNLVISLPAYDFEDHEIHIGEHNALRKSPRYRKMTERLRKGLDAHVKIHENFLKPPPPPVPPGPPPEAEPPLPPPPEMIEQGLPGATPPLPGVPLPLSLGPQGMA